MLPDWENFQHFNTKKTNSLMKKKIPINAKIITVGSIIVGSKLRMYKIDNFPTWVDITLTSHAPFHVAHGN